MTFITNARTPFMLRKSLNKSGGFTLLELIGVMVVIAILAAAVLPSTIDLIQVQRSVNEGSKLPQVAEALKRGMLREQVFPSIENNYLTTMDGNDGYWWNLASRNGGGSASEVRYPLGQRPKSTNTRKLYFAQPSWGGMSFFQVTGNGTNWISDPLNPEELRLILLSTTSFDLQLPDILSPESFDALWDKWSVGNDGNPTIGNWSNYGLTTIWEGRAAELNIQRIDLRDWLSTVVIENHRAIEEAPGKSFDSSNVSELSGNWEPGSLYAYTKNQVDSSVRLSTVDTTLGSSLEESIVSQIDRVIFTKRGKIVDESLDAVIRVAGSKISTSGDPPQTTFSPVSVELPLTLTDYAPVSLLNPYDEEVFTDVTGWGLINGEFDYRKYHFIDRFFLPGQELLLGEPWNLFEVGTFIIDKTFNTLRFDGLQWEY